MSAQPSPSLHPGPPANQPEEKPMPKGRCRYILLVPELKGQRCACVSFTHNKGVPGASCDCGHLACFHATDAETSHEQRRERDMEQMQRRIQALEAQLARGQEEMVQGIVSRVSELEDTLEKSKYDFADQIKVTNSHIDIAYNEISRVDRVYTQMDEQIRQLYDKAKSQDEKFRLNDERFRKLEDRCMELQDADINLEDQLENLYDTLEAEEEEEGVFLSKRENRPRRRSTSDTLRPSIPLGGSSGPYRRPQSPVVRSLTPRFGSRMTSAAFRVPQMPMPVPGTTRIPSRSARSTEAWTVHISLLPHASIPMPFERNTNAYQRCLSRGLHQVVAIAGTDAQSFLAAVTKAFGGLLKGRDWMPLQAKLCDAQQLQGLPMLRQLEQHLINPDCYDAEFLRRHCAVCDANDTMESLYIAMCYHSLSWHALRYSAVYMEGLEASWKHDALLDNDPYDNDTAIDDCSRPAAGDLVTTFPSLKRTSSEISRSNSFSSSTSPLDSEASRVKRTCPAPPSTIVEIRRRGVETA